MSKSLAARRGLTRREFLAASAGAGAGLLLLGDAEAQVQGLAQLPDS